MCWNAEASLTSWVAGSFVCVMLLLRADGKDPAADRVYGGVFLWVLSMQLLEYVIWRDQACTGPNQMASQVAWVQNLTQPAVLIGLSLVFLPSCRQRVPKAALVAALIAYMASVVMWAIRTGIVSTELCTQASSACHSLRWPWIMEEQWIWLAFFLMLALGLYNITGGSFTWLVAWVISTLILSAVFARKRFGSWWCLAAVIGPLVWYTTLGAATCLSEP